MKLSRTWHLLTIIFNAFKAYVRGAGTLLYVYCIVHEVDLSRRQGGCWISHGRSPQNSQILHSDQVDTGYYMYRHEEAPTILITTHLTVTTFSGQMIHFLFELVLKNWLSCNPTANKTNSKIVPQHLAPTSIHLSIYCLTLRHQWMLIRSENNIL